MVDGVKWWMIECVEKGRTRYWAWELPPGSKTWPQGFHVWVDDWSKGARFESREAALAACNHGEGLRVAEHATISAPALPSPPEGEIGEIVGRLRSDAKAIREHVPDDEGSFAAVAISASNPARRTVAGSLHADLLDTAADALTRLAAEREEVAKVLEPYAAFAEDGCLLDHADSYAPRPARGRPNMGDHRAAAALLATLRPAPSGAEQDGGA